MLNATETIPVRSPSSRRGVISTALLTSAGSSVTARASRFLDLLGITTETVRADALVARAAALINANGGDSRCLLLSGEDAIALAEAAERGGVRLDKVTAVFPAIIVHSVNSQPECVRAIEGLLGGAKLAISEFGSDSKSYRVHAHSGFDCGPLAGLSFGPIDPVVDRGLNVLSCEGMVERLIEIDGPGLLTRIRRVSQQVFISTAAEIMDLGQPASRNIDFRTCFSRITPLLVALRTVFRESSWSPQAAFANIIIDDPLLRPRYGHLDLQRLAEVVERTGCACTIGMIPWNCHRSRRKIARLFVAGAPRLGICYHGCNHSGAEFGCEDGTALRGLCVTARQRMLQHEQQTGLRCQPVMVFPQGVFSVEAMQALKATGFLAVANTETQDWQRQMRVTVEDLLRPAILCYGNYPLFARRNPQDGPVNFAMDMFLGRPCLIVLHHDFFKLRLSAFEELVRTISTLCPGLAWDSLENIVTGCSLRKANSAGESSMMIFANEACLRLNEMGLGTVTVIKHLAKNDQPRRVELDGRPADFTTEDGQLKFPLPAGARAQLHMEIMLAEEPAPSATNETLTERLQVAARRYASEFRDNYVAKSDILLRCVSRLRGIVRQP
jgi:hypothetical protein